MSDYFTHAGRAQQLLASVNPRNIMSVGVTDRIAMAQVEAILALAAAIAGQQQAAPFLPPPPIPPAPPA